MLLINGIEGINSYMIEEILFKLRTQYFNSDKNYQAEDTSYDEKLHALEARLNKSSATI